MVEFNTNLWAPWRMEYIEGLSDSDNREKGCFLCKAADNPQDDEKNLVVYRAKHCFAIMNRFPYNTGHLLIAPYIHEGKMEAIDDEILCEIITLTKKFKYVLEGTLKAEGFNIGINLSHCAGAGLPDHFHLHIVPRWSGDTNFMTVIGQAKVVPEHIAKTYQKIKAYLERET